MITYNDPASNAACVAFVRVLLDACESWYSGAFLLETVPCVLFILERHGHDPEGGHRSAP